MKTEAKHSANPGPWKYQPGSKTVRTARENYWIATVDSWDGMANNEANARLIAAAPNQHEALKTIQQLSAAALHDDRMSIETVLKLLRDIEVVSRVAIYSAEGRSL